MNKRFFTLVIGELQRLNKYNVTAISVLVAFIWTLLLFFIEDNNLLSQMLPLVLLADATLMSVLYIGSIMFFEKSESTISTLLVTPVSYPQLIWSKTIANTLHTMFSSLLVALVFFFVKDVSIRFDILVFTLLISVVFHSLLGFAFAYHSKNFTSMLMNVMFYGFMFTLPTILYMFHLIGEEWSILLKLSPTEQATTLILSAFSSEPLSGEFYFGLFYLIAVGTVGYIFYVLPKFKEYAVKQSGV